MRYIRIIGWDEFQHYKKRNPPWIKLHTQLLENDAFECLQADSKSLLICLWLYTARKGNGKIKADETWLRKHLPVHKKPNLQPLINAGFIEVYQDDSTLQATDDSILQAKQLRRDRGETEERQRKYSVDFENFWKKFKGRWNPDKDGYVKVGKFEAFQEWQKLNTEEKQKAIVVADKVSGKYVPDACRWLKRKMFDDFVVR